jgi:hypothetical protein
MKDRTFITKQAVELSFIARQPPITAPELGIHLGITERAIRNHAATYTSKQPEGRGVRYTINTNLPLRQETHLETTIGGMLIPRIGNNSN